MSASTGCDAALWLCGSEKGRTMSAAVYRFYVGIDWATEKHRVVVLDAERRVVRELSRPEDARQGELGRLTNRLREQLHRYYPQLLHLVPAADEPWLWTLLERAPTPSIAQPLPRATVRTILSRHRIRRVDTDAVLATLRAPALPVAPGTVQAAQRHLAVLLPRLRLIHQQRAECATQIEGLLERLGESQEHRDVPILRPVVRPTPAPPPSRRSGGLT